MAIPTGTVAYGVSKAALNYTTRKIHFENKWLSMCFPNGGVEHSNRLCLYSRIPIGSRRGGHGNEYVRRANLLIFFHQFNARLSSSGPGTGH